ncbi:MAG: glycosyltransferase [Prevotella oris]|nr:glycosyltransferase [Segatella oris]
MKKKNITFLISFFLDGGTETVLIEYLRNLSNTGMYNLTLAIGYNMREKEVFLSRIPKDVRVIHLVKNSLLLKRWSHDIKRPYKLFDELFLNPIRRFIVQISILKLGHRSDAIIDFNHAFGSFIKHLNCSKSVFYHYSLEKNRLNDPTEMHKLEVKACNYDHLVTISEAMYQEACHFFPALKDRLCMIYNSINTYLLQHAAAQPVGDERINKPFILSITRLEECQKDVTTLIKAYAILRRKYHHTEELYVIGKGVSLAQLQQTARDCGVEDHVVFLGFMENPLPWTKHCSLFVQSSHFEGLPTTMLEALLLDKMIVATDCPTGPKEILDNGKAGLLVLENDAEALAEAMHKALTDTAFQQQIAKGRAIHSRQFTFEVTEKKFMKLLDK